MADGTFDKLTATNLGIGTNDPNAQLHVNSDVNESKVLVESGSNLFKLSVDGIGATIGTINPVPLSIQTDGMTRVFLAPNGNVGFDKVTPKFKLDVNGIVNATGFHKNGSPWKIQKDDIDDKAVTSDKIANASITVDKLADNSVTGTKLTSNTITGDKLVDNSVLGEKLTYDSVVGNKLVANSVFGDKLADNSVTGRKIAHGTISAVHLAPGTLPVGTRWVADGGGISYYNGNVGIGTTASDMRLDVAGRSRIRQAGPTAGIWFHQTAPAVKDRAFVGMMDDDHVGFWGNTGAQWGFVMNTTTGNVSFGARGRQMINLWQTEYGIGVQSETQYFRSNGDFCWFKGGTHNDGRGNPGGGGTRLMAVNWWGDLVLSARTNPGANPNLSLCRAMVDAGNRLSINHAGDFANGVDIYNGRFVSSRAYKKNITALPTEEAIHALQNLNPVKFNYRTDLDDDLHVGFIAEDVPDLVATRDRTAIGSLDIVAVLTKVVQTQQTTIASLLDRISALEQNRTSR